MGQGDAHCVVKETIQPRVDMNDCIFRKRSALGRTVRMVQGVGRVEGMAIHIMIDALVMRNFRLDMDMNYQSILKIERDCLFSALSCYCPFFT